MVADGATWAAPHPTRSLTGERAMFSLFFEEDGTRAPISFSVAEAGATSLCTRHLDGGRTSIRVWGRHTSPVPVQRNQVRTRDRVPTSLE
jgi:hypothetical protein